MSLISKKPSKTEAKIEADLKKLTKLPGNKTCADCSDKMPAYADVTHNVFVCTKCSGIHREMQFKVKGISVSNFTQDEVNGLEAVGNQTFNNLYLAKYDLIQPNSTDINKFKEFLRQKYVDKRWFNDPSKPAYNNDSNRSYDGSSVNVTSSVALPTPAPLSKMKVSFRKSNSSISNNNIDLLGDLTENKPVISKPSTTFDAFTGSNSSTFDAFNNPSSSFNNGFDSNFGNSSNNGFNSFPINNQSVNQKPVVQTPFDTIKSNPTTFDPFGSNSFNSSGSNLDVTSNIVQLTNSFDAFSTTSSSATTAPAVMPKSITPVKNFNVFDDILLAPAPIPPAANVSTYSNLQKPSQNVNPFDQFGSQISNDPSRNQSQSHGYQNQIPQQPIQQLNQFGQPQSITATQQPFTSFPPQSMQIQSNYGFNAQNNNAPNYQQTQIQHTTQSQHTFPSQTSHQQVANTSSQHQAQAQSQQFSNFPPNNVSPAQAQPFANFPPTNYPIPQQQVYSATLIPQQNSNYLNQSNPFPQQSNFTNPFPQQPNFANPFDQSSPSQSFTQQQTFHGQQSYPTSSGSVPVPLSAPSTASQTQSATVPIVSNDPFSDMVNMGLNALQKPAPALTIKAAVAPLEPEETYPRERETTKPVSYTESLPTYQQQQIQPNFSTQIHQTHNLPSYPPQAQPATVYPQQTQSAPVYPQQSQSAPVYPQQTQSAPVYPQQNQSAPVYSQQTQAAVYQQQTQSAPVYPQQTQSVPIYSQQTNLTFNESFPIQPNTNQFTSNPPPGNPFDLF